MMFAVFTSPIMREILIIFYKGIVIMIEKIEALRVIDGDGEVVGSLDEILISLRDFIIEDLKKLEPYHATTKFRVKESDSCPLPMTLYGVGCIKCHRQIFCYSYEKELEKESE